MSLHGHLSLSPFTGCFYLFMRIKAFSQICGATKSQNEETDKYVLNFNIKPQKNKIPNEIQISNFLDKEFKISHKYAH